MTIKDFKAKYNGRRFVRVQVKGNTIEDIPTMRETLQRMAKEASLELVEDETTFGIGCRFWFKPRNKKRTEGVVKFKSNNAIEFAVEGETLGGEGPKRDNFDGEGWTTTYNDTNVVRYELA